MSKTESEPLKEDDAPEEIDESRRSALARLGIALPAAYAAPALLKLNKAAADDDDDDDDDDAPAPPPKSRGW